MGLLSSSYKTLNTKVPAIPVRIWASFLKAMNLMHRITRMSPILQLMIQFHIQIQEIKISGAYRTEHLNDKAEPANAIWNLRQYQKDEFVDVVIQDLVDPEQFTILNDKIK